MAYKIDYLIVDTSAFIKNVALQDVGTNIITLQEVVDEITSKRQLRRLVVLPYDLVLKTVFPENIKFVSDFAKKTGDYMSLSATDIKVIALTYQLEKEHVGSSHLKVDPEGPQPLHVTSKVATNEIPADIVGFFKPLPKPEENLSKLASLEITDDKQTELIDGLNNLNHDNLEHTSDSDGYSSNEYNESDSENEWITPNNIKEYKEKMGNEIIEDKHVAVACMTTDFAMQNVLKQIGLHVASLEGKVIKQLRTFVFRCYSCFKTTSVMTKIFCPNCGNQTLKKVSVSLDENGKQIIHINMRKPLSGRGKRFSLPTPQGGKHANNPILFEDQPVPDQKPTRLARTKNNPLDPDYIAGFSPFITRDINSRSAMLGIRPKTQDKYWLKTNRNQSRKQRK